MSQWEQVAKHSLVIQQMKVFYNANFPMEVRFYLRDWIEGHQWNNLDETSILDQPLAETVMQEMLTLMWEKISELDFPIRNRLEKPLQEFERIAKVNPLEIVKIIKQCLNLEKDLLHQAEQLNQEPVKAGLDDVTNQIQGAIESLVYKTKETEMILKETQMKQESIILCLDGIQQLKVQLNQLQNMTISSEERNQRVAFLRAENVKEEQSLKQLILKIKELRTHLCCEYEKSIVALQQLQKLILDELESWKCQQQFVGNDLAFNISILDTIQQWCENLVELLCQNRQQIRNLSQLHEQAKIKYSEGQEDKLPTFCDTITKALSSLVLSTFLVEQQPPQVLRTEAKFETVVRLLVGPKLNVHMNPPLVEATIINENQAKNMVLNSDTKSETSDVILNNKGTMEYQASTQRLSINLCNMKLNKIQRQYKRVSEGVTKEKHCIMFQSNICVGESEIQALTLSLPLVVIVHGNQECNAMATVLWDNAFAKPNREPFVVPDQGEWLQLADQLNKKFRSSTGKGLSEADLACIASKLFGDQDPSIFRITWSQFNKDNIPDKQFTFWQWFYAILKLIKEHLKDLWNDNVSISFLSKEKTISCLKFEKPGTFLLRFNDSQCGSISISLREKKDVYHIGPFDSKDLTKCSFPNLIKNLKQLTTLYPGMEKNSVFSKYYTPIAEKTNVSNNNPPYVKPELKWTLPESSDCSLKEVVDIPLCDINLSLNERGDLTTGMDFTLFDDNTLANMPLVQNFFPE